MTTHHCPICSGVTAITVSNHSNETVRWCMRPSVVRTQDAEIARLRALVREAWEEGCHMDGNYDLECDWRDSRAKKAMESQ